MRCPTLAELPPPPPGKTGWPWTAESEQLPDTMPVQREANKADDRPRTTDDTSSSSVQRPSSRTWPKVSIVTPSYNQAQFIEETIRSVLLQGYPDLEYIIIDGGSADGSVEIIRKYEPWLAYWVSEKDEGQSEAINKGFAWATGEFVAWLNSDDWYTPSAFRQSVLTLWCEPDIVLTYGNCNLVDEQGNLISVWKTRTTDTISLLVEGNQIPQQATLMRREALISVGGINESLDYIMDYALWLSLSRLGQLCHIPTPIASFRHHLSSKSVADGYRFYLEKMNWLSDWKDLDLVLTDDQQQEVFRRLHLKTAIEYTFASNAIRAATHFRIALQHNGWPYGDIDNLAEQVLSASSLNALVSQRAKDSYVDSLHCILVYKVAISKSRRLWRKIASCYYMQQVFENHESWDRYTIKSALHQGIYNDPRWLVNLGVVSMLIRAQFPIVDHIHSFVKSRVQ